MGRTKSVAAIGALGMIVATGCSTPMGELNKIADDLESSSISSSVSSSIAAQNDHVSRWNDELVVPDIFDYYGTEDDGRIEVWVTDAENNGENFDEVLHEVDQAVIHWAGGNWGEATWCGYRDRHSPFKFYPTRPEQAPSGWYWRMPQGSKYGEVYYIRVDQIYDNIFLYTGFKNSYQTACGE